MLKDKKFITERYGFSSLKVVESMAGLSAKNYFAQVDSKYPIVIKLHSERGEKEIKQMEVVMDALTAASIPVPRLIKTLKGEKYSVVHNNFLSIYFKIKGKILHEPDFTSASLDSTAKNLAKLHAVQSRLNLTTTADIIVPIEDILCKIKQLEGLMVEKPKGHRVDTIIKKIMNIKLQIVDSLLPYSHDFKQYLLSTTQIVHGDFHNQNILFDAHHKLVGILDFEEIHYGHPMEDITHFIQLACCNTGYNQSNIDHSIFFLKQYLRYIHLPIKEIELGWYLYLYKITSSFFLENRFLNDHSNRLLPLIARDIKKLEYLHTHKNKFISQLLNALSNNRY